MIDHAQMLSAITTLALLTGCELDLLDESVLHNVGSESLARTSLRGYLADQWVPDIEILQSGADPGDAGDATTTVITTAGAIGIVWTMGTRP